jgi:hypothetical protein
VLPTEEYPEADEWLPTPFRWSHTQPNPGAFQDLWNLELVLMFLEKYHQRATADAVAPIVGAHFRRETFMASARKTWLNSWVVDPATGLPDGYLPEQMHPAIQENPVIITDPSELTERLIAH